MKKTANDFGPSRQLVWQRRQNAQGLCASGCGRAVTVRANGKPCTVCVRCAIKSRVRLRKGQGFKPWRKGRPGRPPVHRV